MWRQLFSFVLILILTSDVYSQDDAFLNIVVYYIMSVESGSFQTRRYLALGTSRVRKSSEFEKVTFTQPTTPPPTVPPTEPPPTLPPTTLPPKYSVAVVESNVPNSDYEIDAVGALQLGLETLTTWSEALEYLYQVFSTRHDTHQWKLSSGCSYLILPTSLTYIKLEEKYTGTNVTIFE